MEDSNNAQTASKWQVIIVNYRTPHLAVQAAEHALAAVGTRGTVTIVDSDSQDESSTILGSLGNIEFVSQPTNLGFGAALNAGAKRHREPYLLCLNADVIITPELLNTLEQKMEGLSALGVVGPRLQSPDGTIQPSCRRFPTHTNLIWSRMGTWARELVPDQWSYVVPEPQVFSLCDVVAGACIAVRRELWNELDGMDESFFLFAEDTDFCRRAKSSGWLVGYEPSAVVRHEWGASTGQDRSGSARRQAWSMSAYLSKHFPDRRFANRLMALLFRAYVAIRPSGPAGL